MSKSIRSDATTESVRERKRQETFRRITDAALRLFSANGYDTTTVDALAAEAGISRRTFFHYFKSKDDILLSLQAGLGDRLVAALADQSLGGHPLAATRRALLTIIAPDSSDELISLDRLIRASETAQARKQASYLQDEQVLLAALLERWPQENEVVLRLAATLTISVLRLSLDMWSNGGGWRPLSEVVEETFNALEHMNQSG